MIFGVGGVGNKGCPWRVLLRTWCIVSFQYMIALIEILNEALIEIRQVFTDTQGPPALETLAKC